ncbi:MAG TPA: SEC-C metal-binding domain-containing protein [Tepidisphaeraceae bacterium]|nr:SEC-C metal-binding domain-containing protein [Tepidisphaeraceae bacterium]
MLTIAQILPHLQHQYEPVRLLALRYLADAHDPSPASAEHVWQLINRFGPGPDFVHYKALSRLPHTQASLTLTLNPPASSAVQPYLEQALSRCSHGLLVRFADLIEKTAWLSPELREHLHQRINLATIPAIDLWDRLMVENDPQACWRLAEALSRNPESTYWAISAINDDSIDALRQSYAIELLGMMGFRSASELIFQKLSSAEDTALLKTAVETLVKLASVQVVQLVADRFNRMPLAGKVNAIHILRRIKLRQSESVAIQLFDHETDLSLRTWLASAICELMTTQPPILDRLGEMARSSQYDSTCLDLFTDVSAMFTMVGRTPPAKSTPKPALKPASTPTRAPAPFINDLKHDEELAAIEDPDTNLMGDLSPKSEPPSPKPKPIRRPAAKVGRNDPCPCGSGKKYKKCCGK